MSKITFLFVSLFVATVFSQQCNNIVDNTQYVSANNEILVTLYNIPTAQGCCSACAEFEDCVYFTWVKNSALSTYQQCYIQNENSQVGTSTDTQAGSINRGVYEFQYTCKSSVVSGIDYNNGFIEDIPNVKNESICCLECGNYTGCNYWGYDTSTQHCYLKSINSNPEENSAIISGSTVVTPKFLRVGKRGVGWFNSLSCSDLQLLSNIAWIYNWDYQPDGLMLKCIMNLGLEYIPMVWGHLPLQMNDVYTNSRYLLTFNEPNFISQSNLSPQTAASLWPQIQQFANQNNMKIGSPSASAGGDMMSPTDWFDQFFAACTNCQVDFLTTHIYTCSPEGVNNYLNSLQKYNKPIWLTEFACPAAGEAVDVETTFITETLQLLDNNTSLERYSWFGTRVAVTDGFLGPQVNLFDSSSCALSPVGNIFIDTTYSTIPYPFPASGPPSSSSSSSSGHHSSSASLSAVCSVFLQIICFFVVILKFVF